MLGEPNVYQTSEVKQLQSLQKKVINELQSPYSATVRNELKAGNKNSTSNSTNKSNDDFLGSGQRSPNPPPPMVPVSGNGSGEEMKILLNLMSQLAQILQPAGIQTTQLQIPQPVRVQAQPIHQLLVPQQSHAVLHLGQ